jgi:uncharacterized protein YodC (DUF2158 family)
MFTVGSTVRLVSGSPVMTVISVNTTEGTIQAYWVSNGESNSVQLPAVCFKAATPD